MLAQKDSTEIYSKSKITVNWFNKQRFNRGIITNKIPFPKKWLSYHQKFENGSQKYLFVGLSEKKSKNYVKTNTVAIKKYYLQENYDTQKHQQNSEIKHGKMQEVIK